LVVVFIYDYNMNMGLKHKHFIMDEDRIKRAKALLGTKTETETVERALDEVIAERERIRKAWKAQERFLRRKVKVKDVYGLLE